MKNLAIGAFLFISSLGFSQQREKGTIEVAPVIGIATANYYGGDTDSSNKAITKVNYGADFDYYLNNRWSLRSGLFFQAMGSKGKEGGIKIEQNLNYISVPVNANWHFGSTRNWNLNFGPSLSFLTQAETTIGGMTFDSKDDIEAFQLGLNLGIGYKFEITEKFGLSLSYNQNLGLTEVSKINDLSFKNNHGAFNLAGVFKVN